MKGRKILEQTHTVNVRLAKIMIRLGTVSTLFFKLTGKFDFERIMEEIKMYVLSSGNGADAVQVGGITVHWEGFLVLRLL